MCVHIHTCVCTHTCIYVFTRICMHAYIHAYVYMCVHIRVYIYTNTSAGTAHSSSCTTSSQHLAINKHLGCNSIAAYTYVHVYASAVTE